MTNKIKKSIAGIIAVTSFTTALVGISTNAIELRSSTARKTFDGCTCELYVNQTQANAGIYTAGNIKSVLSANVYNIGGNVTDNSGHTIVKRNASSAWANTYGENFEGASASYGTENGTTYMSKNVD